MAIDLKHNGNIEVTNGVITIDGSPIGGSLEVKTTYPVTTPTEAGTRFWYKGNEWHYMTQDEIDSTGWNGLVEVGFPAPVSKVFNPYLLFNGVIVPFNLGRPFFSFASLLGTTFSLDFLGYGNPSQVRGSLIELSTGASLIDYEITGIRNAHLLTGLEDVGTTTSLRISNASLSKEIIDDFFTQLPPTTKTVTIVVSNNPGSATCDPTIATSKGYTVVT